MPRGRRNERAGLLWLFPLQKASWRGIMEIVFLGAAGAFTLMPYRQLTLLR